MNRPLLAMLFLSLAACNIERGSGSAETETRNFGTIEGIALSNLLDIDVVVGADIDALEITCDDNLLQFIETEIDDGILEIRTRRNHILEPQTHCHGTLKASALDAVAVSGSGSVTVVAGEIADLGSVRVSGSGDASLGTATGCDVSFRVSGSGNVEVDALTACSVETDVSGSGWVTLAGSATELDAEVSGSGAVHAFALPVVDAHARVSGSGSIELNAVGDVDVRVSGSGDVHIEGDPDNVTSDVTGSGTVSVE